MLECVVNISEGTRGEVLATLAAAVGDDLLDVHHDPHHNRAVLTLVGTEAPRHLTRAAVTVLDLREHHGVHPRHGVVDVVPFVPLTGSTLDDALAARDAFAAWAADELHVPCFLYGPERSLPDVRRHAWRDLLPDVGPRVPHPTSGAICVGARDVLVAYNVWLPSGVDVAVARRVAAAVRRPGIRALGLQVGDRCQVSMNLIDPRRVTPADAVDAVQDALRPEAITIDGTELVGLLPDEVLRAVPEERWSALDLSPERTIAHRLAVRAERRRSS